MEQPRVNEKPIRSYREIMAALGFTDVRGRVVGVIVTAHFAAKPVGDDSGAARAITRFMLPARKDPRVSGKPFKPPFVRIPVHTIPFSGTNPRSAELKSCQSTSSIVGI